MSKLYKDLDRNTPALCPMCFCQPVETGADYYCTDECAWCMRFNDDHYICIMVDSPSHPLCRMWKEQGEQ